MLELVSRKNFLKLLEGVDYFYFGNISVDWNSINIECREKVNKYPEYWCSLVPDETFETWDQNGKDYVKSLSNFSKWGYTSHNTRSWETTSIKPKLEMEWEKEVIQKLPLYESVSRPTLQKPGNIMPWHEDKFFYFKHEYPDVYEYVVRFIVFHEDWKTGHYIQAGDTLVERWKQGDVIVWYPRRWHLSSNVGIEDKWTTNITGILKEEFHPRIHSA
jgi:hypothetical protein